jgi:hypothetical protein
MQAGLLLVISPHKNSTGHDMICHEMAWHGMAWHEGIATAWIVRPQWQSEGRSGLILGMECEDTLIFPDHILSLFDVQVLNEPTVQGSE